ncbi:MAG TPA: POTRA domain-containing protein [Polyangia bacterium]
MRRLIRLLIAVLLLAGAHAVRADGGSRLAAVEIDGRLIDDKKKLLDFLGLRPGVLFDQALQDRLASDLYQQLGYRLIALRIDPSPAGPRLYLKVEPVRTVRKIRVHGDWPIFDDDILRHLTVRSGSRLKPDDELQAFLDDEAARVQQYLTREGYFGGEVKIVPRLGPRADYIDLDVDIHLGEWYQLAGVVPSGNSDISRSELGDAFSHCCFRWGRFRLQGMRDDAKRAEKILRSRGYPAARVEPQFNPSQDLDPRTRKVTLPVKVVEKRKVVVKFVGNRAISDKELRAQLTIFSSGAYDEIEIAESAKALQRDYQQHGYFEAQVSFQRRRAAAAEEVTFLVIEGPELKVRGVDFASESGAPLSFSDQALREDAGLETKVFPKLGSLGLGAGGYVTNLQLQQDEGRLVAFYKSRGWPKATARAEVARDPAGFGALGVLGAETAGALEAKDQLYVRFYIDEGARQFVDHLEISFVGAHVKTEADLLRVLKLTAGAPYTDSGLAADQDRIRTLYRSSGRPYVAATYTNSTWNPAHDRVVLRLVIAEGPEVRFGQILIRGNFKTRDRVILADLPFKPGDRFDFKKVDLGERNLQTHTIFTFARVVPLLDGNTLRNPVPVVVQVQERYLATAGSLALAAGIATDKLPNYAYVSAGWLWSNVLGFGSQLELRADFGFTFTPPYVWGASVRYTDLRAFGPGWRLDLTGFYRSEVTYRLGPVQTYGASVGLTRVFSTALRAYLRYDNYLANVSPGFLRTDGPNDLSTVSDNTHTAKFTLGVAWDRRVAQDGSPNPLMPYKGWLLSGSLGWAFPSSVDTAFVNFLSSQHQFLVASGQALGILPFKIRGADFHLMGNLRYDEGIPIGEPALPVVERFYAGGDTTTRGYDPDSLKSEIVRSDVSPLSGGQGFRVVPEGGNIRLLSTVEIQFPIAKSFLGLPWPWVGALFWDMGAIFDAPNLVAASDFKHSVGISLLRILTPVGPLSVEYAYPLNQSLAEERWKSNPWYSHFPGRIHFNWGIPLSRL